ncbi:FKBP-type peptidyl-prolyl cis-trans isomerase [Kineococcus sp. SYSU DK004]|uniref:FKBP-type peptidyl-prolyl cis-trans isomerase n=1 Tax=Kineococcus sp. SYSU DK004 TaxID=3383125 RepID=UPI003D7EB1C7
MRRRTAALPAAAIAALALTLSACASEPDTPSPAEQSASATASAAVIEPAAVDDALPVTVTGGPGAKPEVQVTTPLQVEETTRKVVTAGDGQEVEADDTVQFAYTLYAGSTGRELDTSYGATDARFPLPQVTRGIARGLVGANVGDRLAIAIAPDDGFGEAATQFGEGVDADTTMVLVADVVRVIPETAQGEEVAPPPGLPTVTYGEDGRPTGVEVPEGYQAPEQTLAQPLVQGSGPVVESGQNVTMQYVGARLEDGEVFESSWERQPFQTQIGVGGLIEGWDVGLVGQNVGSRVLLVIPAAQAYGDEPAGGQPAGPLVFVVDILDAY